MRVPRTGLFILCVALAGTMACEADIHDNTINVEDPRLSVEADVDVENVEQGASIPITINAENVYPVLPEATPPAEHADEAVYFKIFVDDEDGEPLVVTASLQLTVQLPVDIEPGSHLLICRMFKHDGTRTDASFDFSFEVKASGSVSTGSQDGG